MKLYIRNNPEASAQVCSSVGRGVRVPLRLPLAPAAKPKTIRTDITFDRPPAFNSDLDPGSGSAWESATAAEVTLNPPDLQSGGNPSLVWEI